MGVLSGDNFSTARGVNDAGQIVGRSGKDTGVERAFLFNGTLPPAMPLAVPTQPVAAPLAGDGLQS